MLLALPEDAWLTNGVQIKAVQVYEGQPKRRCLENTGRDLYVKSLTVNSDAQYLFGLVNTSGNVTYASDAKITGAYSGWQDSIFESQIEAFQQA